MEEQPTDKNAAPAALDQRSPIDLLRRIWIPIEKRTANGTVVFRTSDNEMYVRLKDNSIRRVEPKVNGKIAKRLRRAARRISR